MAGKVDIVFGNETEEFTLVKVTCNSGYVLNGPEYVNCQQGTWRSEFPICTEEEMSSAVGVGIVCTIVLLILGCVMVIAKKRKEATKKKIDTQASLLTTLIEEDPMVDLCERKFPQSTVKAWKDITIERELGSGQFGKVYKGFLHLGKYQR